KTINEHLKEYDADHPRDLIDDYIKEMDQNSSTEGSLFRRGALDQIVNDMFQTGSDTINNILRWVVYLLARYPEAAKRMQDQIDSVVPRDTMVSLSDKPSLPQVEAFIMETLRYSSLLPIHVQRMATQDTTIGGYFIPKGTLLRVGSYSIHFDPRYWTDPEDFNPDRFLDPSGRYVAPKNGFMAFG
ncbi:Cytochrome P450 CYP3214A, partial [Hyalella azteca]